MKSTNLIKPKLYISDATDLTDKTLTNQNLWMRNRKETAGKVARTEEQDASAAQKK